MPTAALISSDAHAVLSDAVCDGLKVRIPAVKLDKEVYDEVRDVMERLGGKWKTAGKAAPDGTPRGSFVFGFDPAPLMDAVIETGEMPPKNPTAFFPTPLPIVEKMADWAELTFFNSPDVRMLEPHGGGGAIADLMKKLAPEAQLDVVEFLSINASRLRTKGYSPFEMDFLEFKPEYQYDVILMNPPFSLEGDKQAYMTHILHAYSLLREGGVLVAIAPTNFTYRGDKRTTEFFEMIGELGEWAELPANTFKESGTAVSTAIIYMKKENQEWKREAYQGYQNWHIWSVDLYAKQEQQFYKQRERIFAQIDAGTLPLDLLGEPEDGTVAAIRAFCREVIQYANRTYAQGIRLEESDWPLLVSHFMDDYRSYVQYDRPLIEQYAAARQNRVATV